MRSLEDEIARLVDPEAFTPGRSGIEFKHWRASARGRSSAILSLIRDRLLSDEAVTAAGMGLTGARWDNGLKLVSGVKLTAREMADAEARAALLAALDRIETHG